jgi:hypothetical protein
MRVWQWIRERVTPARRALRRSATRASAVADALGLHAEQDPEIPTTFCLRPRGEALDFTLWMGSPAIFTGFFHDEVTDWMRIRAPGPPDFVSGLTIRPPTRTYFQWRDGEPGEPPTLVTKGGVPLVVESGGGGATVDSAAVASWIDSFPKGIWLVVLRRDEFEVRAKAPATDDPIHGARCLLDLVRTTPFCGAKPERE